MNNSNEERDVEAQLRGWTVSTTDIRQRVAGAIGAESAQPIRELLDEIRRLRQEMETLRQSNALLHEQMVRLRAELTGPKITRLAPYSPSEGLVRLS